jgi:hypothetical protein
MSSTAGPGTPIDTGLFSEAALERAEAPSRPMWPASRATAPGDHGQAASPVDDDGIRVHEQRPARDLVDVVGEPAHSVGALAASVRVHQGGRPRDRPSRPGSVGSQQLRDPTLEGDRLDLHA